jgi:hypothetical protein
MTFSENHKWNQWFAGFMDGDGSILVYKDHVSIEATTHLDDEGILIEIKKKFGGSIKPRSNARALRWRSRSKIVVLKILETLNGKIYNKLRFEQLEKACKFYNIQCLPYTPPIFNPINGVEDSNMQHNAYFAGLFDADGSISLNVGTGTGTSTGWKSPKWNKNFNLNNSSGVYGKVQRLIYSKGHNQCIIKCTNKNKENLDIFLNLGYGKFYFEENKESQTKWHWIVQKNDISKFLCYLKENPLRGKKKKMRFHKLFEYIKLKTMKAHLADEDSILFKEWVKFCYEWYNVIEP